MHNHGPNFGRYKEGCPSCEAKKARGGFDHIKKTRIQYKARMGEGPAFQEQTTATEPAPQPHGMYLTFEQLQELMAAKEATPVDSNLAEALKEFARELKAPDPEQAEKLAAEKKRKEEERYRRVENARIEMQARLDAQEYCEKVTNHSKENGKTAIVQGQVYNDGNFHPFCLHCGKTFQLIKAVMADMTG